MVLKTLTLFLLSLASAGLVAGPAYAVPSFAQQTGQPCSACHVGGFGPQLTPFGRAFKIGGYTQRADGPFRLPLSVQVLASFVHTRVDQPPPSTIKLAPNDNVVFDQASLFLAGGIGSHVGGFIQTTYDGVGQAFTWDNADLRLVNTGQVGAKDVVYGLSLNNGPGVQDSWNTTPSWGFPYTGSALTPHPAAAPLFAGGLAQKSVGLTGYAWIDSKIYIEAGAYTTPTASTLLWLGGDPVGLGDIHGLAPYGRITFQHELGGGTAEIGAFALKAALRPGRDRTTAFTDHYSDVGVDASWIKTLGQKDTLAFNARYTHEKSSLTATCALGIADGSIVAPSTAVCARGTIDDVRGDVSYYWHNVIGVTAGVFDLSGSANPALNAANRTARPDSTGITLQIDGTPFANGGAPMDGLLNLRVGVQYTAYSRFDGARYNYDGAGAKASDNNALRIFTWVAF